MLYLLGAILCSATIPVAFRFAQIRNCRQAPIITFNYIMCVIIAGVSFIIVYDKDLLSIRGAVGNSLIISIILGIICGAFYYFGFYFYQKSVRVSGAAISSAFGKMGIIIPVLLSAFFWREYPTVIVVLGIILALFAVFICYFDFRSFNFSKLHSVLILFFAVGGLADFTNKIFQKYCYAQHEMIFIFFIFISALVFSLKYTLTNGKPHSKEIKIGLALGVPNMLTTFLLIRALFSQPAYIVFPMFSGGTIVVTLILSLILYKDIPAKKQLVSIFLIILALIFINI